LPRRWRIDREALERSYLSLAAAAHPDRVATGTSADKRAAMEESAALNEGYRVLRDAVARAEYLCRLGGIDLDSSDRDRGAPAMDPAFLMEMIERREAVAEARTAGATALARLRDAVEVELDDALDAAVAALDADEVPKGARALVRRRYLQRLADEIDGES
jgi:molecular chaperone HscB